MGELFQNIIVAVIGLVAIVFLLKKYFWNPRKKNSKSCGDGSCGH